MREERERIEYAKSQRMQRRRGSRATSSLDLGEAAAPASASGGASGGGGGGGGASAAHERQLALLSDRVESLETSLLREMQALRNLVVAMVPAAAAAVAAAAAAPAAAAPVAAPAAAVPVAVAAAPAHAGSATKVVEVEVAREEGDAEAREEGRGHASSC